MKDVEQAILTVGSYEDGYGDTVNMAHVLSDLARNAGRIATALKDGDGVGHDALGGGVGSLTEAVMGVTGGLCEIAGAINNLADAVRGVDKVTVYRGGEES